MGVQEREYLKERPLEDQPVIQDDHVAVAVQAADRQKLEMELARLTSELKESQRQATLRLDKIREMHFAALSRPEVAEMSQAIEHSLVALCAVQVQDEQSRQILCGVHELLQNARLDQGAAGRLPAARAGWEAALQAYYQSCDERTLSAVERLLE